MAFVEIKNKELIRDLRDGTADINAITDYLLRTYSIFDIAMAMAEVIQMDEAYDTTPITVSEADYHRIMRLFRIRGIKTDGETETRGRKKINK